MALGESIGVLFRVKADTDQAKQELKGLEGAIGGLGGGMAALANPATIALQVITAVGAAAVTAAVGMYRLTLSSAEYAGAVFDIKEKTGLSAAALSTLKVNADNAGSSLEQVGNGAARFAKTLNDARSGNDKAVETLKELGVTTYDLEEALAQATKTIYDAEAGTEQLALAQKAFGKGGGELIGTIKQMGGDLKAATKEAQRLGTVMSEQDLAAADALGDAMGLLAAQARVAGVAFTSGLMPILTRFFTAASEWYARNQAEVRQWGSTIAYVVESFGRGMVATFQFIQRNALILRGILSSLTFGISEMVITATRLIGKYIDAKRIQAGGLNQGEGVGAKSGVEGSGEIPTTFGGGGTGGAGGGTAPTTTAPTGPSAYEQARKKMQDDLSSIRQGIAEAQSYNERLFAEGRRIEEDYRAEKLQLAIYEKEEELRLLQEIVAKTILSAQERVEALREIEELESKVREQGNKNAADEAKRISDALDAGAAAIADFEKKQYEAAEQEKKREEEAAKKKQAIREERDRKEFDAEKRKLAALRQLREEEESRSLAGMLKSSGGGLFGNIKDVVNGEGLVVSKGLGVMGSALQSLKTIGMDAFNSLAQGFGQLVSNWVLYGEAGAGGLRKLTASILANVAATATTYALMCLAAAALASTVFGGALMGGTPVQFLKAAALFGAVAVGSAIAGRGLAGDSFSNTTAGGGTSPQGNGNSQNNNFQSGQFGGFGNRLNNTLAAVEDGINTLNTKIFGMREGEVLARGIDQNPNALSDGLISGLQNNSRLTGGLKRAMGDAR